MKDERIIFLKVPGKSFENIEGTLRMKTMNRTHVNNGYHPIPVRFVYMYVMCTRVCTHTCERSYSYVFNIQCIL